ncbi:MAG: hypothetical protein AAB576_00775, partial [Elusimicrobiota bacterium]
MQTYGPKDWDAPGEKRYAAALWNYNMATGDLAGPTTTFYGLNGTEIFGGVEVDSGGQLWVIGLSSNAANGGSAKLDAVLRKYNSAGSALVLGPFANAAYAKDLDDVGSGMALASNALFIAVNKINSAGNRDLALLKYDLSGTLLYEKTWYESFYNNHEDPSNLALDPTTGDPWITGRYNSRGSNEGLVVWHYKPDGAFVSAETIAGQKNARGIAINNSGARWLATESTSPVQFVSGTPIAGAEGAPSTVTIAAGFRGLAFDSSGNLWTSARLGNELRRFNSPVPAVVYGTATANARVPSVYM